MLLQLLLFYIVLFDTVRAMESNLKHSQQTSSGRVKQKFVSTTSHIGNLTQTKKRAEKLLNTNLTNSYEGLKSNYYLHWQKWREKPTESNVSFTYPKFKSNNRQFIPINNIDSRRIHITEEETGVSIIYFYLFFNKIIKLWIIHTDPCENISEIFKKMKFEETAIFCYFYFYLK